MSHAKAEREKFSKYSERKGYHKMVIYGMNYVGVTFLDEFKDTNKYAIDKKVDEISAEVKVVSLEVKFLAAMVIL